jgi:hypothetical protein
MSLALGRQNKVRFVTWKKEGKKKAESKNHLKKIWGPIRALRRPL